jgi:flagellar biosynthesis protein FlhB
MPVLSLRFNEELDGVPLVDINEPLSQLDSILLYAEKYKIPVIYDESLARSLSVLDEGEPIPVQLYRAVAVILQTLQNLLEER